MSDSYRVWCLSWEESEDSGVSFSDRPSVQGGLVEQLIAGDKWALDAENAAEGAAVHYHSHRDAWKSLWPLVFRVRSPDGTLTDFEVDRESVPEFHAREIDSPSDAP